MRAFHLEKLHFGEIHILIYRELPAHSMDQHLIWVFQFLFLFKSNLLAFKKVIVWDASNYQYYSLWP